MHDVSVASNGRETVIPRAGQKAARKTRRRYRPTELRQWVGIRSATCMEPDGRAFVQFTEALQQPAGVCPDASGHGAPQLLDDNRRSHGHADARVVATDASRYR